MSQEEGDCNRLGCKGAGAWRPALLLRTRKGAQPLRATMQIVMCEAHKDVTRLEDLLSDEGWDKISRHMKEIGAGPFSRPCTTLGWNKTKTKEDDECLPF